MPEIFDQTKLSKKSIEDLIDDCEDALTDTLLSIIDNLKKICKHKNDYASLEINKFSPLYLKFLNALQILESNFNKHENIPDNFMLAVELLKDGKSVFHYQAFKNLMKKYYMFFKGMEITPEHIEECRNELEPIKNSFESTSRVCSIDIDILNAFFQTLNIETIELETLQTDIKNMQNNYQDLSDCLQNYKLVLYEISNRLWKASTLYIVITANKTGLSFDKELDKETFFESLSKIDIIINPLTLLKNGVSNAPELLFSYVEEFKAHAETCKQIENFHPKVHRTAYLSQALSLAVQMDLGYCGGGIRYWESLPVSKIIKKPFQFHYELNEIEPNAQLLKLQDNSSTFMQKYKVGNHFYHNIITKKIKKDSLEHDDNSTIVFEDINKNIIDKLPELAKMYYYQATFQFDFYQEDESPGHAVGFKVIREGKKNYYFFRDYNDGEFYTKSLNALKIWIKKFFCIYGYDKGFSEYSLYVIRSKNNCKIHPVKEAYQDFEVQILNEDSNRKNWMGTIKKPLLLAYENFQASADLVELKDNILREKIKPLMPQLEEDDNFLVSGLKEYFALYNNIKIKNLGDYIIAYLFKLRSLDYFENDSKTNILLQLQEAEDIAKNIEQIDPKNYSVYRYLWLHYASYFIDAINDKFILCEDKAFFYLDKFYQNISTLKVEELCAEDGYDELIKTNTKLGELLSQKFIPKNQVAILIKQLKTLFDDVSTLWMNGQLLITLQNIYYNDVKPKYT